MPQELEKEIYNTVKFFSIFVMPVTAMQVWRYLLADEGSEKQRRGGQKSPSLAAIERTLQESSWLAKRLTTVWGYWGLKSDMGVSKKSAAVFVQQYLRRHAEAQRKWKIARRLTKRLAWAPFVRSIIGSGSLAMFNTNKESDLDLLIITAPRRIWTARLFLLLAAQLTGRRRKYWNEKAPDKLCLNHYVAGDALEMPPLARTVYTAVLYAHTVSLWGEDYYQQWRRVNAGWSRRWLRGQAAEWRSSDEGNADQGLIAKNCQRVLEFFLQEWPGEALEKQAERWQRWLEGRHARDRVTRGGRVVLTSRELAFHPSSRAADIVAKYYLDEGQKKLL
jgi:predicted nucleotidyltransferase